VHGHVVVGRARACEVWVVVKRARAAADPRFLGWFWGDIGPSVGVSQILSRTEVGARNSAYGGGVGWCEGLVCEGAGHVLCNHQVFQTFQYEHAHAALGTIYPWWSVSRMTCCNIVHRYRVQDLCTTSYAASIF
jgi:hypothetical protein